MTYVDDTQHIVASENNKDLKLHIQDMHDMHIQIYKDNLLQSNGDKTESMKFCKKNEDNSNFRSVKTRVTL